MNNYDYMNEIRTTASFINISKRVNDNKGYYKEVRYYKDTGENKPVNDTDTPYLRRDVVTFKLFFKTFKSKRAYYMTVSHDAIIRRDDNTGKQDYKYLYSASYTSNESSFDADCILEQYKAMKALYKGKYKFNWYERTCLSVNTYEEGKLLPECVPDYMDIEYCDITIIK